MTDLGCIRRPQNGRPGTLVPIWRTRSRLERPTLNASPRAPGATLSPAARAFSTIGAGRSLLSSNRSGPGTGRPEGLAGKRISGARVGDRNALKNSVGPSFVSIEVSRDTHSGNVAPWYGLSVTMPSVMLMTIG